VTLHKENSACVELQNRSVNLHIVAFVNSFILLPLQNRVTISDGYCLRQRGYDYVSVVFDRLYVRGALVAVWLSAVLAIARSPTRRLLCTSANSAFSPSVVG